MCLVRELDQERIDALRAQLATEQARVVALNDIHEKMVDVLRKERDDALRLLDKAIRLADKATSGAVKK